MRILHIIPNLIKGGAQRIAIDICRELNKREGVEVKLVYFEGENEFEFLTDEIVVQRIDIAYNLSFRKKSTINLVALEEFIDQFNPDVIHSHLYRAELISREYPRSKISYFTHCHDNIVQLRKPKFNSFLKRQDLIHALERKRLLKRYRACNNCFLAIAQDGVNYLKENLPADLSDSVVLLHNAINVEFFKVDRNENAIAHRLINVGNFIPKKNQTFLVDVIEQAKSKGLDLKLTLVGDGVTRSVIHDKVTELGLSEWVDFKGKSDDIKALLEKNSVYVHSAIYEPFGLVLLEAMAAGLPVVSLDGKGNKDLIHEGENGFLVDQGDQQRFVQCIIDLINDPTLYKRIQAEGYKTAEKHDIRPYVDRLLELYTADKN
jgi:glycosyltransferase involved in cell wall biosynthesis